MNLRLCKTVSPTRWSRQVPNRYEHTSPQRPYSSQSSCICCTKDWHDEGLEPFGVPRSRTGSDLYGGALKRLAFLWGCALQDLEPGSSLWDVRLPWIGGEQEPLYFPLPSQEQRWQSIRKSTPPTPCGLTPISTPLCLSSIPPFLSSSS
jgi:hypothetical protein